ncbi:MAG: hypothetical protein R2722_03895 [Tessaracoccus sp.]
MIVLLTGCVPAGSSLLTPHEHGWISTYSTGEVFSDGMEVLAVTDGPITLKDVRTIAPSGVTQLGFKVTPGDEFREDVIQQMEGFPPAVDDLQDGQGAILGADGKREDWWLIIGYEVETDQRWERTGLEILYEKGGMLFRQEFPATLIVCGSSISEEDCWDERLGER